MTSEQAIAKADDINKRIYGSPRGILYIFVQLDSQWAIKVILETTHTKIKNLLQNTTWDQK